MSTSRARLAVLLLVLSSLGLTACGDDEKPTRVPEGSLECRTEGTVESQAAPSIRDAVAPYMEAGQGFRVARKLSGTATVQLSERGSDRVTTVVNLVRTEEGWATTSVVRC